MPQAFSLKIGPRPSSISSTVLNAALAAAKSVAEIPGSESPTTICEVVEVATQLDAIVRLGGSHFEPDIIAVANSQPAAPADEMRTFIRRDHPGSLLVTIGPELLDPAGLANWLSSDTPTVDLPTRIRELIFAPRP